MKNVQKCRHTDTDTQMDIQTNIYKLTHKHTYRKTCRQTCAHKPRHKGTLPDLHTDRQKDSRSLRQTNKLTGSLKDGQTNTQINR